MKKYFAVHAEHAKGMDTSLLRQHFLLPNLFVADSIALNYSHYDRMIVGGIMPALSPLKLESPDGLKASFFLERREMGIVNVGETGSVMVDGVDIKLENKDALYIGRGAKEITFSNGEKSQALFYVNSCPAHTSYPTRKVTLKEAETTTIGSHENANHRTIRKLIVQSLLPTCQLQMGLTELHAGSVWNTLPPHTHDRRMEVYFYFNLSHDNAVCHFMGEPSETRHLWMKNHEAVFSPPWSIHSGAGTSAYSFIWSMAGENLDYTDMDGVLLGDLL